MYIKLYAPLIAVTIALLLLIGNAYGIDEAALAAETEEYCKSTAGLTPVSPELIIKKVEIASRILEKEGAKAYPMFKGKGSDFIFEGTYIWVHAHSDGEMLMHPIKHKMVGKRFLNLKDKKGKRFFIIMNNITREKDSGWVEYYWPKPGTNKIIRKISYVKKCTLPDGKDVVLGCGIYNGDEKELAKLEIF